VFVRVADAIRLRTVDLGGYLGTMLNDGQGMDSRGIPQQKLLTFSPEGEDAFDKQGSAPPIIFHPPLAYGKFSSEPPFLWVPPIFDTFQG
jgi:hypothetical protein